MNGPTGFNIRYRAYGDDGTVVTLRISPSMLHTALIVSAALAIDPGRRFTNIEIWRSGVLIEEVL